jgi:glutamate-1-semialdehyde 2,1-aminomutase
LGKVVGGGFPLAAFGGRADIMGQLAPDGPVYQAGTLSGNPVAAAAGLAQLRLLDDAAYDGLQRRADVVLHGFAKAFADHGIAAQIQRVRSLAGVFFADAPVRDFDDAKAADHDGYARFFHGMLARGIYLPPSGYEAFFFSLAQTDDDLAATVDAAFAVAREMAGGHAG